MLTALVVFASTLAAFQDAPPAAAPTVAAPAPTAQTSDQVVAYLKEAEAQLYDPQAAGLRSLEFDLPVDAPMQGPLGVVHVTWVAGGQASLDVKMAEGVSLEGFPPGYAEQMAQQNAAEFLNTMLNRPISMLLDGGVATIVGSEAGLVMVDLDAPEARAAGIEQQSYYFDDNNLLRRSVTVAKMMGTKVTAKQDFGWRPATEDSPLLVSDSQSIEADMGFMVQKIDVAFTYSVIDGIVLTSSIEKITEIPAMAGGGTQRQLLTAANMVVNGKPAPMVPAAGETTPPAGG